MPAGRELVERDKLFVRTYPSLKQASGLIRANILRHTLYSVSYALM